MQQIFEFADIENLSYVLRYRLILSLFCLLTFIILIYFWNLSRRNSEATKNARQGLLFLSLTFLIFFAMGFATVYIPYKCTYLILSGLISICFLLSLPFFAFGNEMINKLVSQRSWTIAVLTLGFIWILVIWFSGTPRIIHNIDIVISSVSIILFGWGLIGNFLQKKMILLAIISGLMILFTIWLQINSPELLGQGRYVHMNTTILSPAIFLSIISISQTFGWINELNFKEFSQIYTLDKAAYGVQLAKLEKRTITSEKKRWQDILIKDNVEDVISEVIQIKRRLNTSLHSIIMIASRNNRNNTSKVRGLLSLDEYQINRHKVIEAILSELEEQQ